MIIKRITPVVCIALCNCVFASATATTETVGLAPNEMPERLVKVLRTTNKAQTNRYVPKVYEFKNVNPFDVVRFYRRVLEIEEGRFASFMAPNGKSGLVLVLAPEYQIPSLDQLMASIDRPGLTTSGGDAWKYFRLKHRAADDVGFLSAVWGNASHTPTRPPSGSRAPDMVFISDLETNSIFVHGPVSAVDRASTATRSLDVPVPQVLVEATLYEIDLNSDGAVGFDYYAWKNGPGRNAFALGAFAEYDRVRDLEGGVTPLDNGVGMFGLPGNRFRNRGTNVAYFLDVPSAYLDFLVTKGMARVVTAGQILSKIPTTYKTGLNAFGQGDFDPDVDRPSLALTPAEFRANDEILYYRTFTGPTARAGARSSGQILDPFGDDVTYPDNRTVVGQTAPLRAEGTTINQRVIAATDVGTLLQVTPRIAAENVSLGLLMETSSLLGFDGVGAPRISARRAKSDIRVRDGEEVAFGGLGRTMRVQSTRKFPILGSIPVLGWAFGAENSSVRKTVVVSVIRATRLPSGLPTDVERLISQVGGNEQTPGPPGGFGFDQWGLGDKSEVRSTK